MRKVENSNIHGTGQIDALKLYQECLRIEEGIRYKRRQNGIKINSLINRLSLN